MKIIRQSVEIMTPVDQGAILEHIERCGRTCYKSEDRITPGSAEKFVRNLIKRGHESVLEHFNITVRFICDRGVSHEIVRHRLASYCISGDSYVRGMSQKGWTVRELYEWQNDPQRKSRIKLMNIRSLNEKTLDIVPNKIRHITYMGDKPVYKLTTESGRMLKCTADHKLLSKAGWRELEELAIGDFVCVNGLPFLENEEWLRNYYLVENHTRKETAKRIGCCEAYVYRAFKRFGIVKPLSDRPNRRPGYGRNGMISEEAKQKLRELKLGDRNPGYKKDRMSITDSAGYSEAHRKHCTDSAKCEFCGSDRKVEIHHINKNVKDNRKANIKYLCARCHHLWHVPGTIGAFFDRVVSVEYVGVEDVYDISMDSEIHNFVVDGIVVHNCQESTRYVCYGKGDGEITVILPCYLDEGAKLADEHRDMIGGYDPTDAEMLYWVWLDACTEAEGKYLAMLELGAKPEEARAVLPNSLKTELCVTANLREWRHILTLRTSAAAHPQIREVMGLLLTELKEKLPAVFGDIGGGDD